MNNEQREQQIIKIGAQFAIDETDGQTSGRAASMRGVLLSAFKAGAEWADQHPQWIPVKGRLPEEREVVWVRKHFNKEVLGEFDIYDSAAFCNGEFQCDNSCTVTHWMPIVPPIKEDKE